MKNYSRILLGSLLLLTISASFAQITINQSDMPNANDTFRLSITTNVQGADPALTGTNFVWDYTALTPLSQTVDTFISLLSTPVTYNLVFNNFLDPEHKASYATRDYNVINPIPTIQISETYNFFKESSTEYSLVGQGAIINGVATPMKYDVPVRIYKFPLQMNQIDSSLSSTNLQIPTIGYYGQTVKRVNTVDGWGTLSTSLGTFNVIRTKSVINQSDTIYYDAYFMGIRIPRPTEIEYRWIADNKGIPLLQINSQTLTNTVRYRDDGLLTGINYVQYNNSDCILFPNPVDYSFGIFSKIPCRTIEIIDIAGKIIDIIDNKFDLINTSNLKVGFYFVKLFDKNRTLISTNKIIKK